MSKEKDLIRPVLTLGIICLVVTGLLAATNHFTAPIIAENARKKADESRRVVLAAGENFETVELDAALLA